MSLFGNTGGASNLFGGAKPAAAGTPSLFGTSTPAGE